MIEILTTKENTTEKVTKLTGIAGKSDWSECLYEQRRTIEIEEPNSCGSFREKYENQ